MAAYKCRLNSTLWHGGDCTCMLVSLLAPLLLSAFRESSRLFLCSSFSANLEATQRCSPKQAARSQTGRTDYCLAHSAQWKQASECMCTWHLMRVFPLQLLQLLKVGDVGGLDGEENKSLAYIQVLQLFQFGLGNIFNIIACRLRMVLLRLKMKVLTLSWLSFIV